MPESEVLALVIESLLTLTLLACKNVSLMMMLLPSLMTRCPSLYHLRIESVPAAEQVRVTPCPFIGFATPGNISGRGVISRAVKMKKS